MWVRGEKSLWALCALAAIMVGCKARPPAPSGFLGSYDNLVRISASQSIYPGPVESRRVYSGVLVDPVEMRVDPARRSIPHDTAQELTAFMQQAIADALDGGPTMTEEPEAGVVRVRVALTDVKRATWWMNLHPGMKLTGAGLGGAAIEAEIIDSITNEQLFALIEARFGNRVELDTFAPFDDARDAMLSWAKQLREQLDELVSSDSAPAAPQLSPQAIERAAPPASR